MDRTASLDPFRNLSSPCAGGWLRFLSVRARARPSAVPGASRQRLEQGRTCWLEAPAGTEVVCESGTLWLTYDRQLRDIVLEPGQFHRCDAKGRLGIHALDDSRVRIDPPAAARLP